MAALHADCGNEAKLTFLQSEGRVREGLSEDVQMRGPGTEQVEEVECSR